MFAIFENINLRLQQVPNETLQGATTNQTTISTISVKEKGDLVINQAYWLDVKDYDLVCVCHYDDIDYINWYTIFDMRKIPSTNTTINFHRTFFSKEQGDIETCMCRFHIQKIKDQFKFVYSDWRFQRSDGQVNHSSYAPKYIYGLKIVQKQN